MCDLHPRLRRNFLLFTRSKTDRDHNLPTFSPLISVLYFSPLFYAPSFDSSTHRDQRVPEASYVPLDSFDYSVSSHLKTRLYFLWGRLFCMASLSRDHRLSLKPMLATCSLNTLGGKPFVSRSASILFVLICSKTNSLILDTPFHNIKLDLDVFGYITRFVVVSIKYCGLIVAI
jgi:hypothetical protein